MPELFASTREAIDWCVEVGPDAFLSIPSSASVPSVLVYPTAPATSCCVLAWLQPGNFALLHGGGERS